MQGWDIDLQAHTVHACIHEPTRQIYTTDNTTNGNRDQWYFNSDTWSTYVYYNAQVIKINQLGVIRPATKTYENSFTAFDSTSYEGRIYCRTPLGACFSVWAQIGADPITSDLNTGFVYNNQSGLVGSCTVYLPAGFSTVYFPVLKTNGTFSAGNQFSMRWVRGDGTQHDRGWMDMGDFEDSRVYYNYRGYPEQWAYSAMIYPVVCYSSQPNRPVTVQILRNFSGPGVYLGRPIVLPGACSWFINH